AAELIEPLANGGHVLLALALAQGQKVRGADRDDHTVDRLAAAELAQQLQEGSPAGGVGLRIGVLRRVAPGGIEQDRLVREPPVTVTGAADAAHRLLAELLRKREVQPGVDEHGGLPRAWRSDDDVPGQVV